MATVAATSRTTVPNQPGYAYDEPSFTTYDASVGVAKDAWMVTAYGEVQSRTAGTAFPALPGVTLTPGLYTAGAAVAVAASDNKAYLLKLP